MLQNILFLLCVTNATLLSTLVPHVFFGSFGRAHMCAHIVHTAARYRCMRPRAYEIIRPRRVNSHRSNSISSDSNNDSTISYTLLLGFVVGACVGCVLGCTLHVFFFKTGSVGDSLCNTNQESYRNPT